MTSTTMNAPLAAPTRTDTLGVDADEGVLSRLLALALAKVQKKRHRPARKGRLHRV